MNPAKTKLFYVFKVAVLITALAFLWFALRSQWEQIQHLWTALQKNTPMLGALLLLMVANWSLEIAKWHRLNQYFSQKSIFVSALGVLSGVFFGLFTPNRIGEVGGKLWQVKPEQRPLATGLFFTGSFAQMLATAILGGLGLCLIIPKFWIMALVAILSSFSLWFFFSPAVFKQTFSGVVKLLSRWLPQKTQDPDNILGIVKSNDRKIVLLLSFLRYLIFATQFVIALHLFGIEISFLKLYAGVAVTYLLTTFIPTFALAELGVREAAAVFIFSYFGDFQAGVFAATLLIWMVNLVLPALLGGVLWWQADTPKNLATK